MIINLRLVYKKKKKDNEFEHIFTNMIDYTFLNKSFKVLHCIYGPNINKFEV